MGKRLFVAIDISEEVKQKIQPVLDLLSELNVDLKIVPSENLHITLKFLGEVDKTEIRKIEDKLSLISEKFRNFEINFRQVGGFPSMEKLNVLWVGVENPILIELMKNIDDGLNDVRENEHEEVPHLTIARIKSGRNKEELIDWLNKVRDKSFGPMIVDKIILYESELSSDGPKYEVLDEFLLEVKK